MGGGGREGAIHERIYVRFVIFDAFVEVFYVLGMFFFCNKI